MSNAGVVRRAERVPEQDHVAVALLHAAALIGEHDHARSLERGVHLNRLAHWNARVRGALAMTSGPFAFDTCVIGAERRVIISGLGPRRSGGGDSPVAER